MLGLGVKIPATEEAWIAGGWDQYGMIINLKENHPFRDKGIDVLQREKQSWTQLQSLKAGGLVDIGQEHGISLGSFTVSYEFFKALTEEYKEEAMHKSASLNIDSDLWMPMTSTRDEFAKGDKAKEATWERADSFKQRFLANTETKNMQFYGATSVGTQAWSWDYGKLADYFTNFKKLLGQTDESECMRQFYRQNKVSFKEGDLVVENSIYANSRVKRGSIKNSILVNVQAEELNIENCIIIGSLIYKLTAKGGAGLNQGILVYKAILPAEKILNPGDVIAHATHPQYPLLTLRTRLDTLSQSPGIKPAVSGKSLSRGMNILLKSFMR